MKIQASKPWRAACAATAFARLPVEEQLTIWKPKAFACASATATTRSLKESVGKADRVVFQVEAPDAQIRAPSRGAATSGVMPTGRSGL